MLAETTSNIALKTSCLQETLLNPLSQSQPLVLNLGSVTVLGHV